MLKINKDIQIGDTGRTLEMLGETVAETLPVGTIAPYGGSTSQVPQNWLPCDGREVSRLEYAKLFSVIGTRFGVGDGSTTFELPDLQGKVPVGQDVNDTAFDVLGETGGEKTHTLTTTEMPSHSHKLPISGTAGSSDYLISSYTTASRVELGSTGATGGGQAHNNLQPYQVTLYIIKAFDQQLGNLRSESLPVGSEIDFDGTVSEIPEGWEEITNPESYSTTEVKTDKTWIDGKPIYRKVISTGTIDMYSASEKNINHNISNINEVISLEYSAYYSGDNSYYTDWDKLINTKVSSTKVTFNIDTLPSSYIRFSKMYIVLEYTKSTD